MYNMIIADDEEMIRTGLEKLVRTMFPEINIKSICKNGEEVIEAISNGHTDILIIDINMPKKSGLDVARFIYENKLNIQIIMITGYSLFEYAKKAIDYKVNFFFSKPFDSEELIESIKTILHQIDTQNQLLTQKSIDSVKSYNKDKELILLANKGVLTDKNIDGQRSFFTDTPLEKLYVSVIKFDFKTNKNSEKLKTDLIGFGEFGTDKFISCLLDCAENSFSFILISPEKNSELTEWFVKEINNSFRLFYNENLAYQTDGFITFEKYLTQQKQRDIINTYINNLSRKKLKFALDGLESVLSDNKYCLNQDFIVLLKKSLCNEFRIDDDIFQSITKSTAESIREIHQIISIEVSKSYDIIEQINAYAKKNFASSTVSLAEISEKLHMNETYLSRLYKEKTGERFVDFLINVRIDNAKALLRTGKYTVNEVSKLVGYNQIKYFRSLFKKKTGFTASEYIKRSVVGGYDI